MTFSTRDTGIVGQKVVFNVKDSKSVNTKRGIVIERYTWPQAAAPNAPATQYMVMTGSRMIFHVDPQDILECLPENEVL